MLLLSEAMGGKGFCVPSASHLSSRTHPLDGPGVKGARSVVDLVLDAKIGRAGILVIEQGAVFAPTPGFHAERRSSVGAGMRNMVEPWIRYTGGRECGRPELLDGRRSCSGHYSYGATCDTMKAAVDGRWLYARSGSVERMVAQWDAGGKAEAYPDLALRSIDRSWDRSRWEALPDDGRRYEIIDGVLYVTTAPSSFHQWIVYQIGRTLGEQINDTGVGVTFPAPIGVFMPGCDPVQPDLVVVRREDLDILHDRRVHGVPALLVEVLSPSNAEVDTEIKRRAYARCGVGEYWIVRPASRDVVVLSKPDAQLGDYLASMHVGPSDILHAPTLPIHVSIARWFAGAPDTTL